LQQKIEHWQSVSRSIIFGLWETALSQNRQIAKKTTKKEANPENPVDKNGRMKRKKTLRKIHKKSLPRLPAGKSKAAF